MRRLAYTSLLTPLAAAQLASTVQDVLISSVRWNRGHGVTGFLLCDGVSFAQVIEGEDAAIGACFARIAADPRHTALRPHVWEEGGERLFGRWSMCGLTLSPRDDALLTPPDIHFDLRAAAPEALLQHLTGFARREAGRLDALHDGLVAG